MQTPGGKAGQGHSLGSRSQGSPAWASPAPGARPGQCAAAAAVATGEGGLRGAQRKAWRRGLWGAERWIMSVPSQTGLPWTQESGPPAPSPRSSSKSQDSKRLVSRDTGFRTSSSSFLRPSPSSQHPVSSLRLRNPRSQPLFHRTKGPGPQPPSSPGSRSTGAQSIPPGTQFSSPLVPFSRSSP